MSASQASLFAERIRKLELEGFNLINEVPSLNRQGASSLLLELDELHPAGSREDDGKTNSRAAADFAALPLLEECEAGARWTGEYEKLPPAGSMCVPPCVELDAAADEVRQPGGSLQQVMPTSSDCLRVCDVSSTIDVSTNKRLQKLGVTRHPKPSKGIDVRHPLPLVCSEERADPTALRHSHTRTVKAVSGTIDHREGCDKDTDERTSMSAGGWHCSPAGGCESALTRLQTTVRAQHEAGRAQELALLTTAAQAERLRAACAEHEKLVSVVRSVLASSAAARPGCPGMALSYASSEGSAVCDNGAGEPFAATSVAELKDLLQAHVGALNDKLEERTSCARDLEAQLEDLRMQLVQKEQAFVKEMDIRQSQLRRDGEKQLKAAEERALNLEHELSMLLSQSTSMQGTLEQKLKAYEQRMEEMDARVSAADAELQLHKTMSSEKISALKRAVDKAQREAASAIAERNQAVQRASALETRTGSYELIAERLKEECELGRRDVLRAQQQEDEAVRLRMETEARLVERSAEVARLAKLIDIVRDECSQRLKGEVNLTERYEREKAKEELHALERLLDAADRRHGEAAAEISALRSEQAHLREELRAVQTELSSARQRCATLDADRRAALAKAEQMRRRLEEEAESAGALGAERDALAAALADCQGQAAEARPRAEQLAARLSDAEASARAACSRAEDATAALALERDASSRTAAEGARLLTEVRALTARCQDMAAEGERARQAARACERKLADKASECKRLEELLQHRTDMMQHIERELSDKQADLADRRGELAAMTQERDALAAALKGQEGEMQLQIDRLLGKVRAFRHDCQAAKKSRQAAANAEIKATQAAEKLQADVHRAQNKLRDAASKVQNLTNELSHAAQKNKELYSDNHQLADTIIAVSAKCAQLAAALEARERRCLQLQDKVTALQGSLKMAVARYQDVQLTPLTAEAGKDNLPSSAVAINEEAGTVNIYDKLSSTENTKSSEHALPGAADVEPPCHEVQSLQLASDVMSLLADIRGIVATKIHRRNHGDDRKQNSRTLKKKITGQPGESSGGITTDRTRRPSAAATKESSAELATNQKLLSSSTPVQPDFEAAPPVDCELRASTDVQVGGSGGSCDYQPRQEGSLQSKARLLCQELSQRLSKLTLSGNTLSGSIPQLVAASVDRKKSGRSRKKAYR